MSEAADEQARREADEQAQREADEQAQREADERAQREAADPTTRPGRLRELAASPALRRAVAANPSTPLDLLLDLMVQHAEEAAHNAALPLLLLERPSALSERPQSLGALLAIEPPGWLLGLMQSLWSEEVRPRGPFEGSLFHVRFGEWLAQRDDTPPELLGRLCASHWLKTRRLAARNPRAPAEVVELLRAVGDEVVGRSRPPVTPGQLRAAAALGSRGAELVALHPEAPDDLLADLAASRSTHVLEALARRPGLPAALAEPLARGPHHAVWHALAANPSTPVAWLVRYARDGSTYLRRTVARNPSLPAPQRRQLAVDPQAEVRLAAQG
ncbi:MAG: hypothetical protein EOO75_09395, partial [Myxococcales bacterium]